jgi:membrane associated rhomboid family serine protease
MTLIGLNVAVFVLVLLATRDGGALSGVATDAHLRLGVSRDVLAEQIAWRGDDGTVYITQPGEWYRLLTSGFLHFGIIHLGFNMYFLYVLGPQLESPLGRGRFLLLYLASLLGGALGVVLIDSGGITAGASGAVFGLLGAAAAGLWRRGINPFTTGMGGVLLLNIFITFAVPGISIGGHLGGLVAGAICGAIMLAPTGHVPDWARWATPVIVGTLSVLLSMIVVTST